MRISLLTFQIYSEIFTYFVFVFVKAPFGIRELYDKTEARNKRFTTFFLRAMIFLFVVVVGMCVLLSACYNIRHENFDTQTWFQITYLTLVHSGILFFSKRYFIIS